MEYNGGSVLAMKGKDCVAIASDHRLGMQALTVSMSFPKFFPLTPTLYVGLAGLATDIHTMQDLLIHRCSLFALREGRPINPSELTHLLAAILYEKRFGSYFIEPVVAGLDGKRQPFVASMDSIGCIAVADDFAVSGTASSNLFGVCESFYEPNLEMEELFETTAQSLLNAVDRDALSGWGATVTIM